MGKILQALANELRQLVTLRKESLYHSIGRMVWGRHWYLYIIMILIVELILLALQDVLIRSMASIYGPIFQFFALGLNILRWLIPFLMAVFVWGVIPFTRHQAKQVVEDLQQTPLTRPTLYRVFVLHTLGAYLYLYLGKIILNGVRFHLMYGTYNTPWWIYLAPRSYAVSVNPDQYQGILPLTFYRVFVCPLWDLLGHLFSYLGTCVYPVLAVIFLMAYWKRKSLFFVIRRMFYLSLFMGFFSLIYTLMIQVFMWTQSYELYGRIAMYLALVYRGAMMVLWGVIFWYLFKQVVQITPFSREVEK